MSTDWDVACYTCRQYTHLGQRFTSGPTFGYGSVDDDGRLKIAAFVSQHVGDGHDVRIVLDPPDDFRSVGLDEIEAGVCKVQTKSHKYYVLASKSLSEPRTIKFLGERFSWYDEIARGTGHGDKHMADFYLNYMTTPGGTGAVVPPDGFGPVEVLEVERCELFYLPTC